MNNVSVMVYLPLGKASLGGDGFLRFGEMREVVLFAESDEALLQELQRAVGLLEARVRETRMLRAASEGRDLQAREEGTS